MVDLNSFIYFNCLIVLILRNLKDAGAVALFAILDINTLSLLITHPCIYLPLSTELKILIWGLWCAPLHYLNLHFHKSAAQLWQVFLPRTSCPLTSEMLLLFQGFIQVVGILFWLQFWLQLAPRQSHMMTFMDPRPVCIHQTLPSLKIFINCIVWLFWYIDEHIDNASKVQIVPDLKGPCFPSDFKINQNIVMSPKSTVSPNHCT